MRSPPPRAPRGALRALAVLLALLLGPCGGAWASVDPARVPGRTPGAPAPEFPPAPGEAAPASQPAPGPPERPAQGRGPPPVGGSGLPSS